MAQDTQSRKWLLTINNPADKGFTHEHIQKRLDELKAVAYYCISDETGENGTPHTHIFFAASSAVRFSTIKKRFPEAHIDMARGTCEENRAYVQKSGKWAEDAKADTSIPGTFFEAGEMPEEPGQGHRSDIAEVYSLIEQGMSNAEIMAVNPDYAGQISRMDKIRQDILEARYRDTFRELSVTYIFGPTETGKTRSIMEEHGYSNVFRVTDYSHPYDRYASEPVLCLDEFRSSVPISEILVLLEGYPLALRARYAPRQACFHEVYIISNGDLKNQYPNIQNDDPATWEAFLRRIHHVVECRAYGPPIEHGPALDYIFPPQPKPDPKLDTWQEIDDTGDLPF